jgi:cytochrome c553
MIENPFKEFKEKKVDERKEGEQKEGEMWKRWQELGRGLFEKLTEDDIKKLEEFVKKLIEEREKRENN